MVLHFPQCRGDVKGYHAPSYKIKEAASSMLWTIVNQHGQFPPPIGPSNFSSLPSGTEYPLFPQLRLSLVRRLTMGAIVCDTPQRRTC